jgi:hypothetical protein
MDTTPWWATGVFWAGVGITAIVGLVTNVLANLYHNKIVAFLDSRKITSHEKRKTKAFALHKIITALHEGRRDRYIYVITVLGGIIVGITCAASFLAGALVTIAPVIFDLSGPGSASSVLIGVFMVSISLFFCLLSLRDIKRLNYIIKAIEDYKRYKDLFEQQWNA